MIPRTMRIEFAKMRRLRVGVIASLLVVVVVALSLFTAFASPALDPADPGAWNVLLAGMSLAIPLASPLLVSVLASRQVDMEHTGGGWTLTATSGYTAGHICRAKLAALSVVVAAATCIASALVMGAGRLLVGITVPPPLPQWLGFTACVMLVNLAVLALQVVVSARVENQLVALGVGVLGTLVAVFSQGIPAALAHATPWGYYALSRAADYVGSEIVALPLAYPSVLILWAVVTVLFLGVTARFDRQGV